LVFYSARKLGNRLDQLFAGSNRTKRLRFISEAKHPGYVVALSCLMPFLPNGLVPYIAARTKISTLHFLISVYFGSIPTLLVLCAIGNKILLGDYLKVVLLCVLLGAGVLLLYLYRRKLFALAERINTYFESRKNRPSS